jgi:hypothetical protein
LGASDHDLALAKKLIELQQLACRGVSLAKMPSNCASSDNLRASTFEGVLAVQRIGIDITQIAKSNFTHANGTRETPIPPRGNSLAVVYPLSNFDLAQCPAAASGDFELMIR